MTARRTGRIIADLAACAAWASLGAGLVIHGCAPSSARPEPAAARRPVPEAPRIAQRAEPAPAIAPAAPPSAPAPAPVLEERPALPSAEPELRIRVAALRSGGAAVRLSNPSGTLSLQAPGAEPRRVRTPVVVRRTTSGWTVSEGVSKRGTATFEVAAAGPIEFHPPAAKGGIVAFDGTDWPGPMRLVPVTDASGATGLDLVVDVSLERYLPGVLAKELIRGWDEEAFRAQAIAARSFAICEHAHWSRVRHYDMVAGEASQAWIGTTADRRPREAAAATRGMVLAFGERVVPAYYSSTCGGAPADAARSLTRNPNHDIAPLAAGKRAQSRRDCCEDAPRYEWRQSLSVAACCAQLRRWAADQLEARDGRLLAPASERPLGDRVSASVAVAASVAASGDVAPAPAPARAAVPAAPAPASPAPAVRQPPAELASDAPLEALAAIRSIRSIEVARSNAAGRPERLRVVDGSGAVLEMRAEDFRRAVNFAPEGEPAPKERLFSSHLVSARVEGGRLELAGRGFGHGVGMCQYGAQELATRGQDAAAILRTYYPGASVVRAYR
jgi:stage II sporulation protein D